MKAFAIPPCETPTVFLCHVKSLSGFTRVQFAGGKAAPSNPSTSGMAAAGHAAAARNVIENLQSLAGTASAVPLGLEEHTATVFDPTTRLIGLRLTFTDAPAARFPTQLNVWAVAPLTSTVMVAEVNEVEPSFFKVIVKGAVAPWQPELFAGVTMAAMLASFGTGTIGCQPLEVSRLGLNKIKACSALIIW